MQLKVILNRVERHAGFVYDSVRWSASEPVGLEVSMRPHARSRARCSVCRKRRPSYDRLPQRRYAFVPLWGLAVVLCYAPRRVNCPDCGVRVEHVPWAKGKERTTISYQWFLAVWAKRLSWAQTAQVFGTSWDTVYRSVKMAVCWGLRNRDLDGVDAIGVDEVAHKKGHNYLTLVYQIDQGRRRLLWVGQDRKRSTLGRFFRLFGERRTKELKYVCSDMWSAYRTVIASAAPAALHILDRFHIVGLFNKALNQVRAEEARRLKSQGHTVLKNTRWLLLKRRGNLQRSEVLKLNELTKHNLATTKCYLMKEDFQRLWEYKQPWRIAHFFVDWVDRARRSRIKPMQRLAKTLDQHAEQIFNWFEAKGEISAGAVEAMNLKVKLTTRRSYGFRGKNTIKYALYHNLGRLPEPDFTHRFC